jgi:hypothetical protein
VPPGAATLDDCFADSILIPGSIESHAHLLTGSVAKSGHSLSTGTIRQRCAWGLNNLPALATAEGDRGGDVDPVKPPSLGRRSRSTIR